MKLEGNLKDFGLEAIFQLINTDKKTGTLHITRKIGDAEGFIYFRDGKIFGAVSNYNRQPLGERLVNAGHITDAQLMLALDAQKNSKKRQKLGQILIKEGLITQEILQAFVKEQIQNTVFDLLPWVDGDFIFFEDQLPTSEDMGLLLSARKILSQGSVRMDEWDRIRRKVPSNTAVFKTIEGAEEKKNLLGLTPLHWKIVKETDGEQTIAKIVEVLGVSEFEVSSHVFDLIRAGLVSLVSGVTESDQNIAQGADQLGKGDLLDELELSPEDLISDRTQYINELAAMTDSLRHGHKGRVFLPSVSVSVLVEKVHMDRHLTITALEELIDFVKGL